MDRYIYIYIYIHIYIYIYTHIHIYIHTHYTYINPFGQQEPWESQLEKHRIGGWGAVSAEALQGKGSPKRSVFVPQMPMTVVFPTSNSINDINTC